MHCPRCGFNANQPSPFCPGCGLQTGVLLSPQNMQPYPNVPQSSPFHHHVARARGFSQWSGIHPAIASLTLVADLMLFGGEVLSLGSILPISIGAGALLGLITYRAQQK